MRTLIFLLLYAFSASASEPEKDQECLKVARMELHDVLISSTDRDNPALGRSAGGCAYEKCCHDNMQECFDTGGGPECSDRYERCVDSLRD